MARPLRNLSKISGSRTKLSKATRRDRRESLNRSWIAGNDITDVKAAQDSLEGCGNADDVIDGEGAAPLVVKVDKGDDAAVESLEGCKNADEGAEAAQETLNGSGTAGKVVDGDKAVTRDRLGFRAVSTAGLTNGALFLNVVEGEVAASWDGIELMNFNIFPFQVGQADCNCRHV